MIRKILLITGLVLVSSIGYVVYSTISSKCTGSKNCYACKNCSGCKHCAKDGGTCGTCR